MLHIAASLLGAWLAGSSAEPPSGFAAEPERTDRQAVATRSGRQALIGEWRLNPSLSDDPRTKVLEGRPEGDPGAGGPRGWGGRGGAGGIGGGRRGPFGGSGRRGERPAPAEASPPLALVAQRITIANLEPEITMLEPDGATRRLHADGRSYRDSNGAEVKTRWQEETLVVETKAGRRRSQETWSVAAEPRRLTVVLEVERPFRGGTVTIRRVFDPVAVGERTRPPDAIP